MLKRFSVSLLFAVLALAPGCAGPRADLTAEPWRTYLHDGARTNTTEGVLAFPMKRSWGNKIGEVRTFLSPFDAQELSSPVITDSTVFAGSTHGRLYAFDLHSGKVLWSFDADQAIDAPATVTDSLVCFGSTDGVVRCVDRETADERWSYQTRSDIISSPVVRDGRVYISSSDDRVYALDAATGEKVWSYSRGTFLTVAPRLNVSPALYGDRLYHVFTDGSVVCLSAETGRELWTREISEGFFDAPRARRTPLAAGGTVYVIDASGNIHALDGETGKTAGVYNIVKALDLVVTPGRTMIIAGADKVVAVDRVSGSILWKTEMELGPSSTLLSASGHLVVVTNREHRPLGIRLFARDRGFVDALDISTGEKVWSVRLGSTITSNASAAEGRIALITDEGTVEVYSPRN